MDAITGLGRRWSAYQPTKGTLLWAAASGAVATIVVGFAWGGWVTGGDAKHMASTAAADSRDSLVAAVCVERFQGAVDARAQLAELKLLQSYSRGSFIEKGGWAMMPDQVRPTSAATRLCADHLAAL